MVPRSRDKRRDDIAIAVTEGHNLIAFDPLVSVETDVVAGLFRSRRRAIAVDDGHVEKAALVEPQHHNCKNDVETAAGLPPPKGAINSGCSGSPGALRRPLQSAVPSIDIPGYSNFRM